MNKIKASLRSGLLVAGSLVAISLLFAACKKSLDTNTTTPVSALMGFNLIPDKAAIGISLSGGALTNAPLNYTSYTGTYLTIYPGSREVAAYDYASATPLATTTQNFEVNKYYSLFTLGANGSYRNLVVNDNLDSLSAASGQAYVRYINAIPDSTKPAVTLTSNGTTISNENTSFASISDFKGITPADITIKIDNGSTISATRTFTVEKGKVYTILLVGIPGNTDPAKQVQIKYITNGALD